MKFNYDKILERVLKDEGGYTNDPNDPGGPTNFGITLNDYRAYIDANGTADSVKNMTVAQAKVIYKARYWDALRCDDLPSGVDYVVFDYGVNSGISRSAKVLQQLVGTEVDGIIGPATLAATGTASPKVLVNQICDERMSFLKGLRTFQYFGGGWTKRVEGVRTFALSIADQKLTSPAGGAAAGGAAGAAYAWYEYGWKAGAAIAAVLIIGGLIYYFKTRKTNVNVA